MTRVLAALVVALLVARAGAWLSSAGARIVDAETRAPVRLKCVSWYGAHQQSFVAGGLDTRSCAQIAASIVALGANCVRLPLSVELVLANPRLNASLVAAAACPNATEHALALLDCQVAALTRAGLLVVLNIHTSFAGWVGAGERRPQGLWHTERYPTPAWLAALAALAARYARDPRVVGLDIRNEIHDQDGVVITWGRSSDADTDWKAATLLADAAIRDANPRMLVIVSGLSLGYDLRAMQDLPNYRAKFVFTTHVYTFSLWFTRVPWPAVLALALLLAAASLAGARRLARVKARYHSAHTHHAHTHALAYAAAGALLPAVWLVAVNAAWVQQARAAGCASIADDALPALALGLCGLLASLAALLSLHAHENELRRARLAASACLWNAALGVLQAALALFYMTPLAVAWDLRRWASADIPVWVGEFGAVVGDASREWRWLLALVQQLDFAYWPLNGCMHRAAGARNDTFGLLECDWRTPRDAAWTRTVFGSQP